MYLSSMIVPKYENRLTGNGYVSYLACPLSNYQYKLQRCTPFGVPPSPSPSELRLSSIDATRCATPTLRGVAAAQCTTPSWHRPLFLEIIVFDQGVAVQACSCLQKVVSLKVTPQMQHHREHHCTRLAPSIDHRSSCLHQLGMDASRMSSASTYADTSVVQETKSLAHISSNNWRASVFYGKPRRGVSR